LSQKSFREKLLTSEVFVSSLLDHKQVHHSSSGSSSGGRGSLSVKGSKCGDQSTCQRDLVFELDDLRDRASEGGREGWRREAEKR
jgi:hypothetical protein